MKRLRILPGAAGIIALTATIGFVDGLCDVEAERLSRGKISLLKNAANMVAGDALSSNPPDIKSGSHIYLVEICRDKKLSEVKIDAVTGQVLFIS